MFISKIQYVRALASVAQLVGVSSHTPECCRFNPPGGKFEKIK